MSKHVEKTGQNQVDPQSLFSQFDPTRLFENPEPSLKENWFTVAKVAVPVAREAFWQTIVRLYLGLCVSKQLILLSITRGAGHLSHSLLFHP